MWQTSWTKYTQAIFYRFDGKERQCWKSWKQQTAANMHLRLRASKCPTLKSGEEVSPCRLWFGVHTFHSFQISDFDIASGPAFLQPFATSNCANVLSSYGRLSSCFPCLGSARRMRSVWFWKNPSSWSKHHGKLMKSCRMGKPWNTRTHHPCGTGNSSIFAWIWLSSWSNCDSMLRTGRLWFP